MTALEKSRHWADQGNMAPPDPKRTWLICALRLARTDQGVALIPDGAHGQNCPADYFDSDQGTIGKRFLTFNHAHL